MTERIFRYVRYADVEARLAQGWVYAGSLGLPHSQYSVLMEWVCSCGREPA